MIGTIICLTILISYLSLSITLFVRRIIRAKKRGLPLSCCSCSNTKKCSSKEDTYSCSACKSKKENLNQKSFELKMFTD